VNLRSWLDADGHETEAVHSTKKVKIFAECTAESFQVEYKLQAHQLARRYGADAKHLSFARDSLSVAGDDLILWACHTPGAKKSWWLPPQIQLWL